jgi:predicted transcriptional regulator
MERKKTRLNESEMKVMQIIWNAGHPITGQQVLGQITEQYKGSLPRGGAVYR